MAPRGTLRVNVFRDSEEPFIRLLDEKGIKYYCVSLNSYGPVNTGEILEIVKAVGNASIWASLATVIVAFIRARKSRKIIIQTEDNNVFHAEGYSVEEIAKLLENAENITVIEARKPAEKSPGDTIHT